MNQPLGDWTSHFETNYLYNWVIVRPKCRHLNALSSPHSKMRLRDAVWNKTTSLVCFAWLLNTSRHCVYTSLNDSLTVKESQVLSQIRTNEDIAQPYLHISRHDSHTDKLIKWKSSKFVHVLHSCWNRREDSVLRKRDNGKSKKKSTDLKIDLQIF